MSGSAAVRAARPLPHTAEETTMVRHPGNTPPRPKAFTLVELLVVLGIIAVVAAMLMPSLRRAREQANMAICASNLGQIGKAFLMYAQENGDRFPYHADWSDTYKADWIHWWAGGSD